MGLSKVGGSSPRVASALRAVFFALLALFAVTGCVSSKIMRVTDGKLLELSELMEEARGTDLVFVGELHDKRWHHAMQLSVIKALHDSGADMAVGLEMFRADAQTSLDLWVEGGLSEDHLESLYYANWHIPFDNYREILVYARDNKIPLVGLNISREIIHKVFKKGFSALSEEELRKLPGVRCEVDAAYEAFIRQAMGEHDHDAEATFKNFCEAQMVWDTTMAYRSVLFLRDNPGKTLVVLAGSGHSWKRGIPAQVRRQSAFKYVVLLPEVSDRHSRTEVTTDDADYLWLDP